MARMTKAAKAVEQKIEAAFKRHGSNVQFNIMDLSKITAAGRDALNEGRNLDDAVIAAVRQYRKN